MKKNCSSKVYKVLKNMYIIKFILISIYFNINKSEPKIPCKSSPMLISSRIKNCYS